MHVQPHIHTHAHLRIRLDSGEH